MSLGVVTRFQVEEDGVYVMNAEGSSIMQSETWFTFEADVIGVTKRSDALRAIIRKAQAELDDQPAP